MDDHAPTPEAEHLAEPLRSRWSPTVFDPEHALTDDELRTLLDAARWAPSRGNSQPARWFVATRGSAAHVALVARLSRGNAGWVPRASAVLIGAAAVEGEGTDPDFSRYDVGQAAAHLTLQARALGLHAHQFSGYDREALALDLGVPPHVRLLAGVAVGRRGGADSADPADLDREQRARVRRRLAEIAYGDRWGEPWPPSLS